LTVIFVVAILVRSFAFDNRIQNCRFDINAGRTGRMSAALSFPQFDVLPVFNLSLIRSCIARASGAGPRLSLTEIAMTTQNTPDSLPPWHPGNDPSATASVSAAAGLSTTAHQDFRWVEGATQQCAYAEFVERTLDITAGIHTCLQLIYASNLARFGDHDEAHSSAAIGIHEGDKLMRMSIAASALLRDDARDQVECMNADDNI
jgi:hypothetical protein